MSLPAPHLLHVRRYTEGEKDARGNVTVTYGDPQPWHVHAIAPGASERQGEANRDATEIQWTVYAPANDEAPGTFDRVVLDGVEYDLESRPADWTRGPWPHPTAGIVVELIHRRG